MHLERSPQREELRPPIKDQHRFPTLGMSTLEPNPPASVSSSDDGSSGQELDRNLMGYLKSDSPGKLLRNFKRAVTG